MDANFTEIEEELKRMVPANLPDDMVSRCTDAMDGVRAKDSTIIHSNFEGDLAALEESLREFVPCGMPADMISRLDAAMSRWHEKVPVEEKVVPMVAEAESRPRRSGLPGLRSVAAVALVGVGAAWLTTADPAESPSVARRIPIADAANTAPVVFTPGDARASVVSTNDHGVIWTEGGLPVRCLEVEVRNEVFFTNRRGEKLIIAQPKREVMFTPVKLD